MILTASNLVPYLLERGLIEPGPVVDGDVQVVDVGRRNRNFKVTLAGRTGLFVKQVRSWNPQAVATLQRESACTWLAANDPAYAALRGLVPEWRAFDARRQVLVTSLVEGVNLTDHHRRLGIFPTASAAALGRTLGSFHRQVRTEPADSPHNRIFERALPWILRAHALGDLAFGDGNGAPQVIRLLGAHPDFAQALETSGAGWRVDGLIHGDVKWDNCLLVDGGSTGGDDGDAPELRLVDWELADVGDTRWDAGAVLQSYLLFWIASMPAAGDLDPAERARRAAWPLEMMQPAIATYWHAYSEAREVPPARQRDDLVQCTRYAAARMLQTAFEQAVAMPELPAEAYHLMQLSLNVLRRPEQAADELFGLGGG